jgi:acetyl esterase/lipase
MTQDHLMLWKDVPPASSPDDDFQPYLESYRLPGETPRGAVLICPGGGYANRAPHEAAPIAASYNAAGFHAFVVQYRVAPHRHPAPLLDVSRALRIIRRYADDWHVRADKIAVCGFSAGGHLTASIGVHYGLKALNTDGSHLPDNALNAVQCRPDALILAYPVISSSSFAHVGSYKNLLGDPPDPDLLALMSLENQVTADTPPAFLWHTADDPAVPVANSFCFAEALAEHDVPFELHIYPHGRHGLGLAPEAPHVATWMDLSVGWLRGMGW